MSIVLDGTSGITTPEIVSTGGPLVVNASAPDNSVVVNASGNVGIGTSSPDVFGRFDARNVGVSVAGASDNLALSLNAGSSAGRGAQIYMGAGGTRHFNIAANGTESTVGTSTNTPLRFITNDAERMRIDSSGNLLVGTTSSVITNADDGITANVGGGGETFLGIRHDSAAVGGNFFIGFSFNGTVIGSVQQSGTTGVAYVTSSDYRLKHDIQPMTGALARVAALKPCTYTWKNTGETDEGFIAHELQEVCPSAVYGEKDAVETYTDEDGVEQTRIKPQGVDTSFLVATLTAALQELKAINDAQAQTIESLTARVVALEQA